MTRVRLTLTLDRATLAKAAGDATQGGLFGDLIPTQKIVRRKTGKTHVQTFHTRVEPARPTELPPLARLLEEALTARTPAAPAAAAPYVAGGRVMYAPTERDHAVAARAVEQAKARKRGTFEQRQQAGLSKLKGDIEYQRGLWQGRIDRARNLPYHDERLGAAYNHGYHRGYADFERDVRGGLVIPPAYLADASTYPEGTPPAFTPEAPKPARKRKPTRVTPPAAPASAPATRTTIAAPPRVRATAYEYDEPPPAPARVAPAAPARTTMLFSEHDLPALGLVYDPRQFGRPGPHIVFTDVHDARVRITDDTPSLRGSHLLGREGSRGAEVGYRLATDAEVTAARAAYAARRAHTQALDAAKDAVREAMFTAGYEADTVYHYVANLLSRHVDPDAYPPGALRDALRAYVTLARKEDVVAKAAGHKGDLVSMFEGMLIPEKKAVRRKTGKTHTQTFHTRPSHLDTPQPRAQGLEEAARAGRRLDRPRTEAARRKVARAHDAFERAMQQAYGRAPVPHDFRRDPATYDDERVRDAAKAYKAATDDMVAAMDAEAATPNAKPSIESITGTRPDGSPWMPQPADEKVQAGDGDDPLVGKMWTSKFGPRKVESQSGGIYRVTTNGGFPMEFTREELAREMKDVAFGEQAVGKAAGLEGMARDLFAKAIRPNLTAKKITRKDAVTQTYHTGQKKAPAVRTPGAAQPAGAGRQPAQPKPVSVPTRVTGAPKTASAPRQPAQGGQQQPTARPQPQVRTALQQATATGPRPGQRADGLPPKATGASVERAASRASRPKSITSEDIPSPPSYDPDLDAFKAVFEHEGEEGLLKAATTHITRMLRAHRAYLDTVRDRFDAHVIEGHAVINMGLPASGKTSAAKRHALRHGQYLHVDVDALKHMHPEYDPKAPEKVHGFSKKLEAVFWEQAKAQRLPMVLDTTGGNWPKWNERIKALRDAGYHQIGLAYAKVDVDEARRRNLARDRTVPEEVIEGTLAEFDPNHPQNQGKTPFEHMRPHVDRVHVYDHRYEADRHGFTEFGKHHSSAARASAWADYTASERRARAAAGMGKAASLTLAGLFGRLAGYHEDGGTA